MRFLGAWTASLVAVVLVAALVLGRDEPPRIYELTAISAAFEERYASALADLEVGGVLYLRSESRSAPNEDGEFTSVLRFETWVAMRGDVPVARSEQSDANGDVIRILELAGTTRTLLIDRIDGTESAQPELVAPVQTPRDLLSQLWERTIGVARGRELIGTSSIVGQEAARVAGPEPAASETVFAVADPLIHLERALSGGADERRVASEQALVSWAVLPSGTPLGTQPDDP